MKWFVVSVLVMLLGYVEAGVLQCTGIDCFKENEKVPPVQIANEGSAKEIDSGDGHQESGPLKMEDNGALPVAAQNTPRSRSVREVGKSEGVTFSSLKNCLPNKEFRIDCNKCVCDSEGQDYSCTRNDCYQLNNNNNGGPRTKRDTGPVEGKEPAKGRSPRYSIHSTELSNQLDLLPTTPPPTDAGSDPNFRCNPGEQFKKDCNDCSCSADGKSYFCTVLFCDQDITPPSAR